MNKVNCLLVIDDDQITTYINLNLFKRIKICDKVLIANNGKDGIDKLNEIFEPENFSPALIFLDINMPIMDGFEFVEAYNTSSIPKNEVTIVVLTSSGNENDRVRMSELGIKYYLTKPLTIEKIEQVILQISHQHV